MLANSFPFTHLAETDVKLAMIWTCAVDHLMSDRQNQNNDVKDAKTRTGW